MRSKKVKKLFVPSVYHHSVIQAKQRINLLSLTNIKKKIFEKSNIFVTFLFFYFQRLSFLYLLTLHLAFPSFIKCMRL